MEKGHSLLKALLCIVFLGLVVINCNSKDNSSSSRPDDYIATACYIDPATSDSSEIYLFTNGVRENDPVISDGFYPENVDISKDGSMITYSKNDYGTDDNTTAEIYVMDLATRQETRVTNNGYWDYNPNLSPDNLEVVYWSSREDIAGEIHISKTDGTNERKMNIEIADELIIAHAAYDPEWSYDGSMIAFPMGDGGAEFAKMKIFVGILNNDHSAFTEVFSISQLDKVFTDISQMHVDMDPAWSIDDTKIVFASYEGPGNWGPDIPSWAACGDPTPTGACKQDFLNGYALDNIPTWKIKTVDIDFNNSTGTNIQTVFDGDSDYIKFVPIWVDNSTLFMSHKKISVLSTYDWDWIVTAVLLKYDLNTQTESIIDGTGKCLWADILVK